MNILIRGVAAGGNHGATALALSLIQEIDLYTKTKNNYILVVPQGDYLGDLKEFDQKYVSIIRTPPFLSLLERIFPSTNFLFKLLKKTSKINKKYLNIIDVTLFEQAIVEANLIIDESGIAFVGDSTSSLKSSIYQYLNHKMFLTKKKNYFRYTQSYGPFPKTIKGKIVKLVARKSLKRLPLIFARGEESYRNLKSLKMNTKIEIYPDIAITLKPKYEKELDLLDKSNKYTCVVPSTCIYNLKNSKISGEHYVRLILKIIEDQVKSGHKIILLAHTRVNKSFEKGCDFELCKKIYQKSKNKKDIIFIRKDYGPRELKWLISKSDILITSRFHALVAGLTEGVKCIAIGWNEKYKDIAKYYLPFDITVDARIETPTTSIAKIKNILNKYEKTILQPKKRQEENVKLIHKSIKNMMELKNDQKH